MTPALAPLAAELERYLGLAPAAVGERLLARAVAARVAATHSDSPADYRARLTDAERAELAEEVVVAETWFLRYPDSFRHLAEWAKGRGRPVRVLCVPCSTGEEPYSVALTLLDAGVSGEVLGVDVSRRAVAAAHAAAYSDGSFRDAAGRAARDRYCEPSPRGWRVRDAARRMVSVRAGNLTAPGFLAGEAPYDAVFCRNLFIYLTPTARAAATANLLRLLAPDGVLYMGHAEPLGLTDDRFRAVPPSQAFAFVRSERKASGRREPAEPARVAGAPSGIATATPTVTLSSPPDATLAASLSSTPPATRVDSAGSRRPLASPPPDPLTAARTAADRGDPRAALALLTAPTTAEAFTLLGVAHTMLGDPAAADAALTRALYLDPAHADALLHRLTLAEVRGDATAAANFRRRLARAAP